MINKISFIKFPGKISVWVMNAETNLYEKVGKYGHLYKTLVNTINKFINTIIIVIIFLWTFSLKNTVLIIFRKSKRHPGHSAWDHNSRESESSPILLLVLFQRDEES